MSGDGSTGTGDGNATRDLRARVKTREMSRSAVTKSDVGRVGATAKRLSWAQNVPRLHRPLAVLALPVAPGKPERHILTVSDNGGFVTEFLAYLRVRKWLWLFPIVVIGLLLILMAALLFGPDVALKTLYQIF
jgi:hypothetical protein